MQLAQPVSVFLPICVHSLWTVSPEKRPFGLTDKHQCTAWSAEEPQDQLRPQQTSKTTKTQSFKLSWYHGLSNSVFFYHTVVFATCWILYHKLTSRISSGYRRPCTCRGAHYKVLHTERYVFSLFDSLASLHSTSAQQSGYFGVFHMQKREQANTTNKGNSC